MEETSVLEGMGGDADQVERGVGAEEGPAHCGKRKESLTI